MVLTRAPGVLRLRLFPLLDGDAALRSNRLRWSDVDLENRRVRIRRSRVLGEDGRTKTGRSRRDIIVHEGLDSVLRTLRPHDALAGEFVFRTPRGAPIDEANFQRREWPPALRALGVRPRPFYNCRQTDVSTLLAAGAKPLSVCRQTGTSLEMIEKHYGDARVDARRPRSDDW